MRPRPRSPRSHAARSARCPTAALRPGRRPDRHEGAQAGQVRRRPSTRRTSTTRASPRRSMLSIEIGADGKVGDVDGRQERRRRLTSTPPPSPPPSSSSSSRPRSTASRAPVKIDLPLRLHDHREDGEARAADQLRRRGARTLQEEARSPKVVGQDQGPGRRDRADRRGRPLRVHRRPARQAQGRALAPEAHHRRDRGDDRQGQAADGEVPRRGEGRGRRRSRSSCARRASRRRRSRPASAPRRRGASPARRATRSRSCRTCPASARSSFGSGAADRLGLGAQGHARQRRRRRDPGAVPRRRPALDGELRPGPVDRSVARRATAPSTAAGSAAWCASSSARCRQGGRARLRRRRRPRRVGAGVGRRRRRACALGVAGRYSYLDRLLPR